MHQIFAIFRYRCFTR